MFFRVDLHYFNQCLVGTKTCPIGDWNRCKMRTHGTDWLTLSLEVIHLLISPDGLSHMFSWPRGVTWWPPRAYSNLQKLTECPHTHRHSSGSCCHCILGYFIRTSSRITVHGNRICRFLLNTDFSQLRIGYLKPFPVLFHGIHQSQTPCR